MLSPERRMGAALRMTEKMTEAKEMTGKMTGTMTGTMREKWRG
jgi:hypothetical protein